MGHLLEPFWRWYTVMLNWNKQIKFSEYFAAAFGLTRRTPAAVVPVTFCARTGHVTMRIRSSSWSTNSALAGATPTHGCPTVPTYWPETTSTTMNRLTTVASPSTSCESVTRTISSDSSPFSASAVAFVSRAAVNDKTQLSSHYRASLCDCVHLLSLPDDVFLGVGLY